MQLCDLARDSGIWRGAVVEEDDAVGKALVERRKSKNQKLETRSGKVEIGIRMGRAMARLNEGRPSPRVEEQRENRPASPTRVGINSRLPLQRIGERLTGACFRLERRRRRAPKC